MASLIWQRFGDVPSYVEPFAGSLAVLLGRPHEGRVETVNDLDGFVANAFRAIAHDPEAVAHWADWPVSECDLTARHLWLVKRRDELTERLAGDPDYHDVKIAGWWLWGIASWIGSGWCSGAGPWIDVDGRLVDRRKLTDAAAGKGVHRQLPHLGDAGQGVHRKRPHLGNAGQGVHRQLPHLGNAGRGVLRQLPHLGDAGQGVHRQRPHLGDAGVGVHRPTVGPLVEWFGALSERLRRVRVCCGDWRRVVTPAVLRGGHTKIGPVGILLDPPYSDGERCGDLYARDSGTVAADVREWAIAHGDDPRLRIALCGYDTEHAMPAGWTKVGWKAQGGYGNLAGGTGRGKANRHRETIWFSPGCLVP